MRGGANVADWRQAFTGNSRDHNKIIAVDVDILNNTPREERAELLFTFVDAGQVSGRQAMQVRETST